MQNLDCPDWLRQMPKTELHCHLAGSIRIKSLLELAEKRGIELPFQDEDGARKMILYKRDGKKSLQGYLDAIKVCESIFVSPEAFQRVSYEICEDASKENIRVLELRFGPTNYVTESLKLYEIMEATLDGLKTGARDFNMYTGLIVCGIRTDLEATRRAAEIAVNYQPSGVVGFDIAGQEHGHRPKELVDVIQPVLDNFLPVTAHAGEADTVASVAEALKYLNAQRISHGITTRESPKILNYLDKTRKCIEICLTSNVDTGAVSSYDTHPVRVYYQRHLRLSINSDNRTISDTNVTKEYCSLMRHLGFNQKDIYALGRHGIKSAFLDSTETRELLNEFDAYVNHNSHDTKV